MELSVIHRVPPLHQFPPAEAASLTPKERIALVLFTALYLAPIWLFTYFPSQDGPTHLENAMILTQYFGPKGGLWNQYFLVNGFLTPTWLNHLTLAGLVYLMPPFIAEKVFLSGYLIGMIWAFYYCLRSFDRRAGFCVALIFPFLYNYLIHMGFYSFSYSFIIYLVVIGYLYRHRSAFAVHDGVAFVLLSLLLYLLHPISFIMALIFASCLLLLDGWSVWKSIPYDRGDRIRAVLRKAAPVLIMLFVTILAAAFATTQSRSGFPVPDILPRIGRLFSLSYLITFNRTEYLFTILFAILLAFLLFQGGSRFLVRSNPYRGLLLPLVVYLFMYLVLPNRLFGGGWVVPRLGLFTILLFLIWMGLNHHVWRLRAGVQIGAYIVAFGLLAVHVPKYIELNDYLSEYLSAASHISPGATLLPISFDHCGRTPDGRELIAGRKMRPFLHCSGYIAVTRGVVEFSNYEAARKYFPLVYRSNLNPYVHIGEVEGEPPLIRSFDFPEGSGGRIDYILVWGRRGADDHAEAMETLMRRISKRYELLFQSRPRGMTEVWRRKDSRQAMR